MVMMYTTVSVLVGRLLCCFCSLAPIRGRLLRYIEDRVYSKNSVIVDIMGNLIIVAGSVVSLVFTASEKPNVPVRVLAGGYVVQCSIHVVSVCFEYRRVARRRRRELDLEAADDGSVAGNWSFALRCDSLNMMASHVWGILGLYWLWSGGKLLKQNAPWLYRLSMAYQAWDLISEVFGLAAMIVCFKLPSIIATRHTVADQKQEGAPEADLNVLPKYRFHMSSNGENPTVGAGVMVPVDTDNGDSATECVLLPEDAECSICLGLYEEGIELHALPCNHHFHSTCIEEWFKINATCPVCKFNILNGRVEV